MVADASQPQCPSRASPRRRSEGTSPGAGHDAGGPGRRGGTGPRVHHDDVVQRSDNLALPSVTPRRSTHQPPEPLDVPSTTPDAPMHPVTRILSRLAAAACLAFALTACGGGGDDGSVTFD